MTAQRAEKLVIECQNIDFDGRELYAIIVGEDILDYKKRTTYKFEAKGDQAKFSMCTALWRGYVSTYTLDHNGELTLVKMEYPFTKGSEPDTVNEKAEGNFWLDMRPSFFGGSLYVPFKAGKVVLDKSKWVYREKA